MASDEDVLSAIAAKLMGRATNQTTDGDSATGSSVAVTTPPVNANVPSAHTALMAVQDTIMTNNQNGPPLRGTDEQLQAARQLSNTKTPKLRHAGSFSGSMRRSATISTRHSPENRRYHPQMNINTTAGSNGGRMQVSAADNAPSPNNFPQASNGTTDSKFPPYAAETKHSMNQLQPSLSNPLVDVSNAPRYTVPSIPKFDFSSGLNLANHKGVHTITAETTKPENHNLQAVKNAIPSFVSNGTSTVHNDQPHSVTGAVKTETIAELKEAIVYLQRGMFELSCQFELVKEGEERRKFLGTDHAKTPYEVLVVHDDIKVKVQADATMKVADLIRRIRFVCSIMPDKSFNPRITFEGKKVGHGMMLGEVGITSNKEVHFTFGHSEEEIL